MSKVCLVAVDIRSTYNVGSFFRTADGFGAAVALVGITPRPKGDANDNRLPHVIDKTDRAIAKTALGAEASVEWRYFSAFDDMINALKTEGYHISAIEQSVSSLPITDIPTHEKHALLVGPEVAGLTQAQLDICDDSYEIPMKGNKESFNVSVAAAIALYQISGK